MTWTRQRWSESSLPLLAVFAAAFGGIVFYDLVAVTGADRVRIVHVGPGGEESGLERERVTMAAATDPEVQAALARAKGGDTQGARDALRAMVATDPKRTAAWSALGGLALENGEPALAMEAFAAALALSPDDADLRFDFALACERSGKETDAEREYAETVRRNPAHFAAWFNLGSLRLDRGDTAGAVEALTTAVPLVAAGTGRSRVLTRLGTAHRRAGETGKALAAFDEAILHGPGSLDPRLGRARVLVERGELDGARSEVAGVLALDPGSATGHFILGQISARAGDGAGARREYAEAVRLRPGSWEARYNLGRAELAGGNAAAARILFEKLRQERPGDAEVLFHLGRIAHRDGRHAESAVRYREALAARKGEYPEASLNLGLALRAAGDRPGAEQAYREALAKRPDYSEAMYNLGLLALTAADLEVADGWFEKAAAADPAYAEAWFNRGVIAVRRKRNDEAEKAYRKAIAIRADYPEARLNLAALLSRTGRFPAAIEEGRAAIRLAPADARAWFNLGRAYSGAAKSAEAEAAYRRALEIDPDYGAAWLNLGVVLADAGDPRGAIKVYRDALDREAGDVKLRYNLALQYKKVGDLPAAEGELRRVVRLEPAYEKGWKLLEEVVEAKDGAVVAKLVHLEAESARKKHPESIEAPVETP